MRSDYDTIQKRRNIIVGVFVIIGACALVWLVFKFGDLPVAVGELRSYDIYVQFPEAPGVEQNTSVRLAGYQVGRVVAIEPPRIMPDLVTGQRYHQTVVVIAIDNKFKNIPSNVRVKLMKRGLGSSYISLDYEPNSPQKQLDPNNPESVFLYDGVCLQGSTGVTSEFFPEESQRKLSTLITSLNTLILNANTIIGDMDNQKNIRESLANLSDATKQATATLKELQKLSTTGSDAVTSTNTNISKVSDALVSTSFELNQTIAEFKTMLQTINKGQGSAGRFIQDATLYENLTDAGKELQLAMDELRALIQQSRQTGVPIKLK
ncbi:MAG: hypothetical protein A2178_01800 [Planctomycetes bacterium GWC2_49_10]|nr:MAG: hypothetical protein A2178_01800 [Planctomycetes bacterium GWC2_49_10]